MLFSPYAPHAILKSSINYPLSSHHLANTKEKGKVHEQVSATSRYGIVINAGNDKGKSPETIVAPNHHHVGNAKIAKVPISTLHVIHGQ